jgi:PKD repeat protein
MVDYIRREAGSQATGLVESYAADLGLGVSESWNAQENYTYIDYHPINLDNQIYNPSVPPVLPSYTNPPTDPNHDGLYEDINGNGNLDFNDVVIYYDNIDWIEKNAPLASFDYNHNNLIDFNDVVKLYDML